MGRIGTCSRERRAHWINRIVVREEEFVESVSAMEEDIEDEVSAEGSSALLEHLQLCGAIPESYQQDSRHEKLYSKYTDVLLAVAFRSLGFRCEVLRERVDSADVEVRGGGYALVADAKAFRLSRTAKNQKDFKVQSLRHWRRHRDYALLVCPIFQYPSRTSQIYEQAIRNEVCLFSYTHLRLLLRGYELGFVREPAELLRRAITSTRGMEPTKSAEEYWSRMNSALLAERGGLLTLWSEEKTIEVSALEHLKAEALECLEGLERRIRGMTHEEATTELIRSQRIGNHTDQVRSNQRTPVADYA